MNPPTENDASASARAAGATKGALPRNALSRFAWFLVLWLVLIGADLADLPAGALSAALATWVSLLLLPPGPGVRSPAGMARLALRFLLQSVIGGADVARRALDPRLPLRPGFVVYPVHFPPGMTRNVFTTLTSLLPGAVPTGEDNGQLVYHCLDVNQPVVPQLAAEEAALARALRDD